MTAPRERFYRKTTTGDVVPGEIAASENGQIHAGCGVDRMNAAVIVYPHSGLAPDCSSC